MGHVLKILILQVLGFNTALSFNFTCPEGALRKLRSNTFCTDEKQYHCMYDTLKYGYVEKCIQAKPIREGKYSVLSGNLDARECQEPFYSPYAESPVWSNDTHRCYFLKSLCNEEGQVTVSNGSSSADRLCRCDYTRGYDYITKPKDRCKCSPSAEDCSCFIRVCSERYDRLNQDYECIDTLRDKYICDAIPNQSKKKTMDLTSDSPKARCSDCSSEFTSEQINHLTTVPLLSIITVFFILIAMISTSATAKAVKAKVVTSRKAEAVRATTSMTGQETNTPNVNQTGHDSNAQSDSKPEELTPVGIHVELHTDKSQNDNILNQCEDMEVVNCFVKTKQLDEMRKAFHSGNRLVILRGIAGSGKTQAAHYHCQQEKQNYSVVAKINATDSNSLFDSLKKITEIPKIQEGNTKLTIKILCYNIEKFLNDECRSTLRYLFLVDNVQWDEENNLKCLLSLVDKVKNLEMILTTYDKRLEKNYTSVSIEFNGMEMDEIRSLLSIVIPKDAKKDPLEEKNTKIDPHKEKDAKNYPHKERDAKSDPLKEKDANDDPVEKLISCIGKLPIAVHSARQCLLHGPDKNVIAYIDTLKSLEPIEKIREYSLEDNKYYDKDEKGILDSLRLPLRYVKRNIMQKYGSELWEIMMLLPFLCYESVSTTVLEACYFHMPKSNARKKTYNIGSLITECERFSLCYITTAKKSKFKFSWQNLNDTLDTSQTKNMIKNLTFHEVTMAALGLIEDDHKKSIDNYFEYLLKVFCFEIDIDARTDKTLQRNLLFVPHAKKLLRKMKESNFAESDKLLFYTSYLNCAIGSSYLFSKTFSGIRSAHIHLVRSRRICLKIVDDKSYFTKKACIFLHAKSEPVKAATQEHIEFVAKSVFQKEFDENDVQDFVLGMRRSSNDVEAIKTTSNLELELFSGHYLQKNEYVTLIKKQCAISANVLGRILLGELLLRILVNNGRALNEILYTISDEDKNNILKVSCNTEFHNANEFCKLLKKQYENEFCKLLQKQEYQFYPLFVCLENDRTGRMLSRFTQTSIEAEEIETDIAFYKNLIDRPFESCFNFGVLKMSTDFNDRHICMCRRILIRFHQLQYENEKNQLKRIEIFKEGCTEVQKLQEKLGEMELEIHQTWLPLPLFHIQCAKFLLLSQDDADTKKALKLFEKATKLEESRTDLWTRYKHEGYHGSVLCWQILKQPIESKKVLETLEGKYSKENTGVQQIKILEYKRWC